ncbi:conserved hypothetical protein [Neospora caninum Liverpool]|uniref:Uncharacterized protein n=1 Tax=Neospora caninum (strain Liverpool) TaxID=572307 RepID=F0VNZ7_NEOCL|nr:conserved hypothetical protein [Neospora caninum Liverpool]CBZ55443.1 conserved hypothetical protein [Neospora caninum Liverpool]CEL70179.1 TPA: hypothetical protein BN1204_058660 [Neospora caninum Liverpool]|eukprot:XP_003885471.1 conserved hypothetical protein [Neospora caninum Liverpool]
MHGASEPVAGTIRFLVRPADPRLVSSSFWTKLRKGFMRLLQKEKDNREWIPVHAYLPPDEPPAARTTSREASGFFAKILSRDEVDEDQAFLALGARLPQGFNASFELEKRPNGELECVKSPWVANVHVEAVRGVTSPEGVPFYEAEVRYDDDQETGDEAVANLPAHIPLTPNTKVFKRGMSQIKPEAGLDASLVCQADGRPPIFVTDDDEEQEMPELQPGPWSVSVIVKSKVNPLTSYGRSYYVEIIDNVSVTVPPQRILPLSFPGPMHLNTLLQLELAVAAGHLFENARLTEAAKGMPARCKLVREALYVHPVVLDCPLWHIKSQTEKQTTVLHLKTSVEPKVPTAEEAAVLRTISQQALHEFAEGTAANKSPLSLKAQRDVLNVEVDMNDLSSDAKQQLKNLASGSGDRLQFKLEGPAFGNIFGEGESRSTEAQGAADPGLVRHIYRSTVTEPYQEAKRNLAKNLALAMGFALLFNGGLKLWSWWQDDKATRRKLALIEAGRDEQKFEPKYLVKPAQATDVFPEPVPDGMM